jgi:hypothetical protein
VSDGFCLLVGLRGTVALAVTGASGESAGMSTRRPGRL